MTKVQTSATVAGGGTFAASVIVRAPGANALTSAYASVLLRPSVKSRARVRPLGPKAPSPIRPIAWTDAEGRRIDAAGVPVVGQSQSNLLEVVPTLGPACGFSSLLNRGEQQRDQD